MTATQFLDLLAERDLVAPEVLQSLRQQLARARHVIPPVAFANLLIDRGHLTFYQAMKLLNTGAAVQTLEEADSQRMRMAASRDPSRGDPGSAAPATTQSNPWEASELYHTATEEQSLELQPLEEETVRAKPGPSSPPAVTFFVDEPSEHTAAARFPETPRSWTVAEPREPPVQSQEPPLTPPLPPLAGETEDLERMGQVVNSPTHRGMPLPPIQWKKRSLLEWLGFGKK